MKYHPKRLLCALLIVCAVTLCGLAAYAAEAPETPLIATPQATPPQGENAQEEPEESEPEISEPQSPEETPAELYPADVRTETTDTERQIVKTYALAPGQSPADIPREGFDRDGWRYTLTDITERKTSDTTTKNHVETVTVNTDTNDLNAVIALLTPTLDYQAGDGFTGMLTLDLSSVKCEAAGYKNTGYTVSATREYPHLSSADTSLIPKTVTENGRTLTLADVAWEAQNTVNVDYEDIPDGYRAIAKYTAKATKTVAAGYVTTADYTGEISKTVTGDTTYTAYFEGKETNPSPAPTGKTTASPTETPKPTATPTTVQGEDRDDLPPPLMWIIPIAAALALLAGAGAWWFLLRHNVKVYSLSDGRRALVAKDKISAKRMTVDLSPLEGRVFGLEIDKHAAKALNGKTIEVLYGPARLQHRIAYEGSAYNIEVDFAGCAIKAVH
jgi:hypothetical protein